jgi:hypothetical protein
MFKKLIKKLHKKKIKEEQKPQLTEKEQLIKEIKEYENDFLNRNKNASYDFFGYFNSDEESPFFSTPTKHKDGIEVGTFVYVYTPKMLKHCVTHLTNERKVDESLDIENFVKMCNQIAKSSKYQEESWEDTINELVEHLKPYAEKLNNEI